MKIVNQTKNTTLSQKAILASTLFKRLKGLLGRRDLNPGEALILKPCNSIHTLFMHFPIDVLFVDRNSRVIDAIPNLKPFRLTYIYLKAVYAIELPAGTLKSSFTQKGDLLAII